MTVFVLQGHKWTILWCFYQHILALFRACSLILIHSMQENMQNISFCVPQIECRGQLTVSGLEKVYFPLFSPYCPLQWSCRRCSSVWTPLRRAAGRRHLGRWSASTESRRTAPESRPAERHNTRSEAALHHALWGYESDRKITLAISA